MGIIKSTSKNPYAVFEVVFVKVSSISSLMRMWPLLGVYVNVIPYTLQSQIVSIFLFPLNFSGTEKSSS